MALDTPQANQPVAAQDDESTPAAAAPAAATPVAAVTPSASQTAPMAQPGQTLTPYERPRAQGNGEGGFKGLVSSAEAHTKNVLGDIFQTLAGGKKKVWVQTDQGPVARYDDLKPGEMARGILAAALTGLASGYDPARRGKGPAMGAAFSAGFKGEEEAKEKQADTAERQAQEQFKNQGIADERTFARHRDAREQQASIERAQEHTRLMDKMDEEIKFAKVDHEHAMLTWQNAQADRWSLENSEGAIVIPGSPEKGFATKDEANDWANKNPVAALGGKNFNTRISYSPIDGRWFLREIPIDTGNIPQWHGVKVDKDGNPVLKDGKMQIDTDHPLYNAQGKMIVPSDKMTLKQFNDYNEKTLDDRAKRQQQEAMAQELRAKALELKDMQDKSDAMRIAREHLKAVGGDTNKVDKNGNLILTADDRYVLMHQTDSMYAAAGAILDKAQKEMEEMPLNDPRRQAQQALIDQQKAILMQAGATRLAYAVTPNANDVILNNMVANEPGLVKNGQVDPKEVAKRLDRDALGEEKYNDIMAEVDKRNKKSANIGTEAAVTDAAKAPGSPQEVAAAMKKADDAKIAAQKAEEKKAADKQLVEQYTKPDMATRAPRMGGSMPNVNYDKSIADAIAAHPNWTDQQKADFVRARTGGKSVELPEPPKPGTPATQDVMNKYLAANNGDKQAAANAMAKDGWGKPQAPWNQQ